MSATSAAPFDPAAYKATTREQWQQAAEPWHRWGPTLEAWLGEATETMLDLAGVDGGRVACSTSPPAPAGRRCPRHAGSDPTGAVLATDLAPAILDVRRAEAAPRGPDQRRGRAMDAEDARRSSPARFDAAISPARTDLPARPARRAGGMRRVLRPGGRLAAIVFSTPDRNGFFSVPGVDHPPPRRTAGAPVPGQPGPFSLGATACSPGALGCRRLRRDRGATPSTRRCSWPRPPTACASSGVLRRAAPDAVRRSTTRVARRRGTRCTALRRLRGSRRLRGPVRAARGRCDGLVVLH